MASALLRVVRCGTQICLCRVTYSARTSKVARILESTIRPCSVVPKLQRSNDVLSQNDANNLEKDVESKKSIDDDSVDSLLKSVTAKKMSGKEAASVLLALGRLAASDNRVGEATSRILNDNKFVVLCSVIDDKVTSMSDSLLIATQRSLITIGVSANDRVMESVETQVLWKIRSIHLKHLITLFVIFVDHQETDLQKRVFTEVVARLQQRWFEVSDVREVATLLRYSSNFRTDFIHKLEDRVIDLVENGMSADNLHRLFVTLAEQRMRSTHLMRCITYHLAKHQQKLTLKQIANLTNAMSFLSYSDQTLLRQISDELLVELPGAEYTTAIAAILIAFGRIQWRHPALMEAVSEWLLKNISHCRVSDLVAYVLTSSRVQCGLSKLEGGGSVVTDVNDPTTKIFDAVLSRVTRESVNSDSVWLNVVWSLAILGRVNLNQVRSVLDKSFYQDLISSADYQSISSRRKISNIHAVAKWELGHKEPLPDGLISDENLLKQSKVDAELRKSILDTLSNFIPKGKFLLCNKWTSGGIFVDAEFVLDKEGKPLPVDDFTTKFGEISSRKTLPSGASRMVLLVQDFKDFTLNSVALTGFASLSVRILAKTGYKVVQVPYSEYNLKAPTLKRLQYLQLVIKNAIDIANKKTKP